VPDVLFHSISSFEINKKIKEQLHEWRRKGNQGRQFYFTKYIYKYLLHGTDGRRINIYY
jgi:hypothetical protein